jgi:hypothetical protein
MRHCHSQVGAGLGAYLSYLRELSLCVCCARWGHDEASTCTKYFDLLWHVPTCDADDYDDGGRHLSISISESTGDARQDCEESIIFTTARRNL